MASFWDEEKSSTKKRKKAVHWNYVTEDIIISLWEKHNNELRSGRKTNHIYLEMEAEMAKHNYQYTVGEIKEKIHNLKNRYKRERKNLPQGYSGDTPVDWPHFSRIHDLLSGKVSSNREKSTLEDSIDLSKDSWTLPSFDTPPPTEPVKKKFKEEQDHEKETTYIDFADESFRKEIRGPQEERSYDDTEKKRKNRVHWNSAAVNCFISIWAKYRTELRSSRNLWQVFSKMETEMKARNHRFTASEIKEKIHNLTNRYRQERKNIDPVGIRPSNWPYYSQVDKILNNDNFVSMENQMDESLDMNYANLEETDFYDYATTPVENSRANFSGDFESVSKQEKREVFEEEILHHLQFANTFMQKEMTEMKEMQKRMLKVSQDALEIDRRRNQILERMAQDAKNFHAALLQKF